MVIVLIVGCQGQVVSLRWLFVCVAAWIFRRRNDPRLPARRKEMNEQPQR